MSCPPFQVAEFPVCWHLGESTPSTRTAAAKGSCRGLCLPHSQNSEGRCCLGRVVLWKSTIRWEGFFSHRVLGPRFQLKWTENFPRYYRQGLTAGVNLFLFSHLSPWPGTSSTKQQPTWASTGLHGVNPPLLYQGWPLGKAFVHLLELVCFLKTTLLRCNSSPYPVVFSIQSCVTSHYNLTYHPKKKSPTL